MSPRSSWRIFLKTTLNPVWRENLGANPAAHFLRPFFFGSPLFLINRRATPCAILSCLLLPGTLPHCHACKIFENDDRAFSSMPPAHWIFFIFVVVHTVAIFHLQQETDTHFPLLRVCRFISMFYRRSYYVHQVSEEPSHRSTNLSLLVHLLAHRSLIIHPC